MNLGLEGKRAIVMAASRGLGYASAMALAREGCQLLICSRNEQRISAAAAAIAAETGVRVHAVAADVSSPTEARTLVDAAVSHLGGLDIVVHNAGGPPPGDFFSIAEGAVAAGVRAEPVELRPDRRGRRAGDEAKRRRTNPHDRVLVHQAADSQPRALERAARRRLGARQDALARAGAATTSW